MIKVKLLNFNKGRNQVTFRPFLMYYSLFREIGIEFVEGGDYDFEFIGMHDFLNKKIPLSRSVNKGLEFLESKSGPIFLFDGSDSTSLMGSFEMLQNPNVKYLFKNQILKDRHLYLVESPFNKWWWPAGSDLDLSYEINEEDWKRIKLTGWNLGTYTPSPNLPYQGLKDIDVCAVYQAEHDLCFDHKARNDIYYTKHRQEPLDILRKQTRFNIVFDKRPYHEYISLLQRSKLCLSPFGMGELCHRDFEAIHAGVLPLKPTMEFIETEPNFYIKEKTYQPVKVDWSNLEEAIEEGLKNVQEKIVAAQKLYREIYSPQRLVLYWYRLFSELEEVV